MSLKLHHILCATDGTAHSDAAVVFASNLAATTSAKLTILAVQPFTLGRGGPVPLWDPGKAKSALDKARGIAREAGVDGIRTTEADAPDVADAIVSVAGQQEADHIVVGSGGKSALKRAMVGSVSSDVVHKASCPVTVVH